MQPSLAMPQHKPECLTGQLFYAFQPVYSAKDKVVAYEALARCQFFHGGDNLKPSFSAQGIEQISFELQVSAFISSLLCFSKYEKPNEEVQFYLNVDPSQFTVRNMEYFVSTLKRNSICGAAIGIEITEREDIKGIEFKAINILQAFGITVALDDFGTGFSNITALVSLPFDCVKFDRDFLYMYKNPLALNLMKSMHDALSENGFDTVIEGIETKEGYDIALSLGATGYQGYYLGREEWGNPAIVDFKI